MLQSNTKAAKIVHKLIKTRINKSLDPDLSSPPLSSFHYHLHIYPRYAGDSFDVGMTAKSILSDPKDRIVYAKLLKDQLERSE